MHATCRSAEASYHITSIRYTSPNLSHAGPEARHVPNVAALRTAGAIHGFTLTNTVHSRFPPSRCRFPAQIWAQNFWALGLGLHAGAAERRMRAFRWPRELVYGCSVHSVDWLTTSGRPANGPETGRVAPRVWGRKSGLLPHAWRGLACRSARVCLSGFWYRLTWLVRQSEHWMLRRGRVRASSVKLLQSRTEGCHA